MGLALGHGREAMENTGYQALLQNSVRWLRGYPVLENITDCVFASGTETAAHYVDLDEIGYHPKGASLRYRIAGNSNTDLVGASIDSENRIRLNFVPDHTGSAVIQVRAESPGGLADTSNPDYLIDGDFGTRWSSDYRNPSWITLDLGEPYAIDDVKRVWEAAHGRDYEIQVSNDAEHWNTVYKRRNGEGSTENIRFDPVTARFVRLYGKERATRWDYSLYQVEVYGENAGAVQASHEP